jgi:hypothetical protein
MSRGVGDLGKDWAGDRAVALCYGRPQSVSTQNSNYSPYLTRHYPHLAKTTANRREGSQEAP